MNKLVEPVPEVIRVAREQFLADFVELLKHRAVYPAEKWVAYHGRQRLGFATMKVELVKRCLRRGLSLGEFLVLGIDPATADSP